MVLCMGISYWKDEWCYVWEYLVGKTNGVIYGNILPERKDKCGDVWKYLTGKTNGMMYVNILPERRMV